MDLISRKAAIDEFDKGAWGVEWDKALAKAMVDSLPSAQPERPRGEWIMTKELDEDVATCPFCGAEMRRKSTGEKPEPPNFCHSCGADLRGGKDV